MQKLLYWDTGAGRFYIARSQDGRFHPLFDGESLGSYATPELALDDLTGGHTSTVGNGINTASLGIPDELSEWHRVA